MYKIKRKWNIKISTMEAKRVQNEIKIVTKNKITEHCLLGHQISRAQNKLLWSPNIFVTSLLSDIAIITVLRTLIFSFFLDSTWKKKYSELNASKHSPNAMCSFSSWISFWFLVSTDQALNKLHYRRTYVSEGN